MLSKEQIESIRTNIRNRGIETIDLEIEMVDHISTAVEEKMQEGKSFRDAFKIVMIEFGPHGMSKLQQKKYNYLQRKGLKLIGEKYLELLTPPKVFASLCFTVILYVLFLYYPSEILFDTIGLIAFTIFLTSISYLKIKNFKKNYSQVKSFDRNLTIIYFLFYLPYSRIFFYSNGYSAIWKSIIIMSACIFFYSYLSVFRKSYEELDFKYKSYLA